MKHLMATAFMLMAALPLSAHADLGVHIVNGEVSQRPVIAPPPGWKADPKVSDVIGASVFIPKNTNFNKAQIVILASAVSSDHPEAGVPPKFDDFVTWMNASGEGGDKRTDVSEVAPITTADGQVLRVFRFHDAVPEPESLAWHIVAYGQEVDDFGANTYLVFHMSGFSQAIVDANLPAFQTFLSAYRK